MKSRYIVLALLFSVGIILTLTSCRTRYIPTSVLIATDTPTNTPLNTATPTLTPSATPTRTASPTPTRTNTLVPTNTHTPTITLTPVGPTNTFTDTPTFTNTPTITPTLTITDTPTITNTPLPTNTPTDTATNTATPTITDTLAFSPTPTATSTNTSIPAILKISYTFETNTEGWTAWGGTMPAGTTWSRDTTDTHGGSAGSLKYVLPYGAGGGQALLGIVLDTPSALADGTTFCFWYKASSATGNAQLFNQSGPATTWNSGSWQNSLPTVWTKVCWNMVVADPVSMIQFGIQMPGVATAITSPVTIWIDDVTLDPPVVVPTCVALINGCENLTENGNWTTPDGRSTLALSTSYATQGTQSIDINVTTANGWNKIAGLDNFSQTNWSSVSKMVLDMHVDSSVTTGAGYCQIALQADSSDGVLNSSSIYSTTGNVTNGSVTIGIGIGGAPVTNLLRKLYFVLNEGTGTTGHIYIDNIRLIYSPSCPTATPTPIAGATWYFEGGTQEGWVMATGGTFVGTGISVGTPGINSTYCLDVAGTYTGGNQSVGAELGLGTALNATTYNGIRAKVYIDANIAGDYPCVFIQLGDGTTYPLSSCVNPAQGGWMQVDFPAASWTGLNKANLNYIKIYIQSASGGTWAAGHVKIDNVEFY